MNTLFDIDDIEPISLDKFCRTCLHRERHSCNSKIIQYCGIRKSNRTDNGQLKIKCKTVACNFYKKKCASYLINLLLLCNVFIA